MGKGRIPDRSTDPYPQLNGEQTRGPVHFTSSLLHTFAIEVNVSLFVLTKIHWSLFMFFCKFGMSIISAIDNRMVINPNEKKGKVKPPVLYRNDPTAGPGKRKSSFKIPLYIEIFFC